MELDFYDNAGECGKRSTVGGFTLVEVLVAMAIGAIVMTSVVTSFLSQQRTYRLQDELLGMQQNLRAAMDIMTREIRMAGYDPSGDSMAGVVYAAEDEIEFTMDLNENGSLDGTNGADPDEWVVYRLNSDGSIGRQNEAGGDFHPVAENFDGLEFFYIMDDGSMTLNPATADFDKIRGVTISLLARTQFADPGYVDTGTYQTGSGAIWGPFNDGFRRQLLVRTVMCRNMGLRDETG